MHFRTSLVHHPSHYKHIPTLKVTLASKLSVDFYISTDIHFPGLADIKSSTTRYTQTTHLAHRYLHIYLSHRWRVAFMKSFLRTMTVIAPLFIRIAKALITNLAVVGVRD